MLCQQKVKKGPYSVVISLNTRDASDDEGMHSEKNVGDMNQIILAIVS
jgi:hypothetical protein